MAIARAQSLTNQPTDLPQGINENAPPPRSNNLLPRFHQPVLPALQTLPTIPQPAPNAHDRVPIVRSTHPDQDRAAGAGLAEAAGDDGGVQERAGAAVGDWEK